MTEVEEVAIPAAGMDLYGRLRSCGPQRPTVVLLCGLGFHTFEYEPLADWLAAQAVSTLSFDYRGHGRSPGRRGRWTLTELAGDADAAVAAAQARSSGPIVLFGNSLGAMIALLAARQDTVAGVVASNCPSRIGDFLLNRPRRMLLALAKALEPVLRPRISVGHFYSYAQLTDDPTWLQRVETDHTIAQARRLSTRTYRALLEWDGPRAISHVHTPTLLLQGQHDRLQPPDESDLLRAAAAGPVQLQLLPTGHLPHLDATGLVGDVLVAWIARTIAGPHQTAS